MKIKTAGRGTECDIVLDHASVSRIHAHIEVTREGYLAVQDAHSANGTYLNRNGHWIRVRKVILGTQDRLRLGELEVPLERLLQAFDNRLRVQLREGYSVRGKPLVFDEQFLNQAKPKIVLENPRRNPVTGIIEENR
jgi:pSer/pThr/pTyr-binding forkhead associated (FHA) protein